MALPLMLANILGGVGQGIAGAGEAVDASRKEGRQLAAQQSLQQHQRRMEEISAEKGTVDPESLTALYDALQLPVPSNLAGLKRIPEGIAKEAMAGAQKQAETDRMLRQGATVADDLTNQYGRVVPKPGETQPGPIKPVVDDPYLRTILSTVRTTGLTDKTAPQVEGYGKFQAERAADAQKYERGQDFLRQMGILPPKAGATSPTPTPPGAPAPTSGGQTFNWLPKVTDKGVEVHATAPTDATDTVAIEKYGTLFRNLDEAKRADVAKLVQQRKVDVSASQGAAGVTAKAAAESGLPLYQSKRDGQHIIDLKGDAEVDYFGTKGADLEKNSKGYKLLGGDQYKQWVSIKEMEGMLGEFERIAPQLVKQPGLNKLQQLEFWAKNALGVPGLQTDLDALRGATLRVAKAMQGSAQGLSDADRKTVEGMLPTEKDTADSAVRRLAQTIRILGHMKSSVLGQSRASDKVRDAVGEIATPAPGTPGSPWQERK